ncbi:hypothetical protein [Thiocystis violacea]|uniref:hypothetical protein n=1 Tax=Thiocystis violacea TaxID=13725 RepID=UPI001907BEBC|nr:hypothetical protein [Thiocystis violacea]
MRGRPKPWISRDVRAAPVKIQDLEASRASWKERALAAEREGKPSDAHRSPTPVGEEGDSGEAAQRLALSPPFGHQHSLLVMPLTL